MKTNELRIGNWVQFKSEQGFTEFVRVTQIIHESFVAEGDEVFHNDRNDGPIMPIQLTPLIIENCGFQRYHLRKEGRYKDPFFIYFPGGPGLDYGLGIKGVGLICSVKYLHQLQNLCFALSGKELNINMI